MYIVYRAAVLWYPVPSGRLILEMRYSLYLFLSRMCKNIPLVVRDVLDVMMTSRDGSREVSLQEGKGGGEKGIFSL